MGAGDARSSLVDGARVSLPELDFITIETASIFSAKRWVLLYTLLAFVDKALAHFITLFSCRIVVARSTLQLLPDIYIALSAASQLER